ncbi:hypothetical protein A7A08_02334 [Methyloligella halotolerans]|uniref:DUF883 domain-containing protein n=1 Tax=Methyloligella halotolerans TaxID=1177755 RepID=A0A1E2RWH3_9HYPH|nr:hypothetical protein [Methyloligella halotolerans]ODA66567.1 hypothetical protein A7A08_02334 [Methyloligella halotolerans]
MENATRTESVQRRSDTGGDKIRGQMQDTADGVSEIVAHQYERVKDTFVDAGDTVGRAIQRNPLTAISIGLGLGFLFAFVIVGGNKPR